MRVLVVGKGGREHALCWRLNQSPTVDALYCTAGNPGIAQLAGPVAIDAKDYDALADFAQAHRIDLTVVGPDDPLVRKAFGAAGERVVVEERLRGEELSFFALCDGSDAVALGSARDYKRVFEGDRGPNTGGMGSYSPVPGIDSELEDRILAEVVRPTLAAMAARGAVFRGVLYAGLMIE